MVFVANFGFSVADGVEVICGTLYVPVDGPSYDGSTAAVVRGLDEVSAAEVLRTCPSVRRLFGSGPH